MTKRGVVTLQLIKSWTPIALSMLALGFTVFNFIANTTTRLTVLEMTVEKNVIQRLDNIEIEVQQLQRDFRDHQLVERP